MQASRTFFRKVFSEHVWSALLLISLSVVVSGFRRNWSWARTDLENAWSWLASRPFRSALCVLAAISLDIGLGSFKPTEEFFNRRCWVLNLHAKHVFHPWIVASCHMEMAAWIGLSHFCLVFKQIHKQWQAANRLPLCPVNRQSPINTFCKWSCG